MEGKNDLTNIFLEMHYLFRRYHMIWYGKNFGGLDPAQGQGRILKALRRTNNISQKELGRILDIRPQSLGELLQKLETGGYIKRYRSLTDKRSLIVELTDKGENFQLQKPAYDELFNCLTAAEKDTLKNSLEKISEQLSELIEKETKDDSC